MKEHAGKDSHPGRSRVEKDNGSGATAHFYGELKGAKHEGAQQAAKEEHPDTIPEGNFQAPLDERVGHKARAAKERAPEGRFQGRGIEAKEQAGKGGDERPECCRKGCVEKAQHKGLLRGRNWHESMVRERL